MDDIEDGIDSAFAEEYEAEKTTEVVAEAAGFEESDVLDEAGDAALDALAQENYRREQERLAEQALLDEERLMEAEILAEQALLAEETDDSEADRKRDGLLNFSDDIDPAFLEE